MQELKRHAPFWIMIYLVWTYIKSNGGENVEVFLIINLFNIAVYIIAYATLKHIYIPRFFNRKKYVFFVLSLLGTSILLLLFMYINDVLWFHKLGGWKVRPLSLVVYLQYAVQYYSPAMVLLAWESQLNRIKEQNRIQELENEKLATELKYLKAQLNPHFLFNTLNNLYSQVILQSKAAPDMILQLSGILDYVLYRSQHPTVFLREEIETIHHFLALEQIRYGDRLDVSFEVNGNFEVLISPLLFLSLVENAFKHGVGKETEKSKVKINITEEDQTVCCRVWNTKGDFQEIKRADDREGIGLSNIKRQLKITYPAHHTIQIEEDASSFCVIVTIKMKS